MVGFVLSGVHAARRLGARDCRAFDRSFARLPPAAWPSAGAWMHYALALPPTLLQAALLVAAPAITVAATLHLALAAVTRIVPRFGGFSLAFPAVFAAALALTVMTLPLLVPLGARPWLVLPVGIGPASDADKPFTATPSRRRRAQAEGNVARSTELGSVAAFAGATLAACARAFRSFVQRSRRRCATPRCIRARFP